MTDNADIKNSINNLFHLVEKMKDDISDMRVDINSIVVNSGHLTESINRIEKMTEKKYETLNEKIEKQDIRLKAVENQQIGWKAQIALMIGMSGILMFIIKTVSL